jgi:hypothetical protein
MRALSCNLIGGGGAGESSGFSINRESTEQYTEQDEFSPHPNTLYF